MWEAPCKCMDTSLAKLKYIERVLAKLKATNKSFVGQQKEPCAVTAACDDNTMKCHNVVPAQWSHQQGSNSWFMERLQGELKLERKARVAQVNSKDTSAKKLDLAHECSQAWLYSRPPRQRKPHVERSLDDKDSNNLPAPSCLHPPNAPLHSS